MHCSAYILGGKQYVLNVFSPSLDTIFYCWRYANQLAFPAHHNGLNMSPESFLSSYTLNGFIPLCPFIRFHQTAANRRPEGNIGECVKKWSQLFDHSESEYNKYRFFPSFFCIWYHQFSILLPYNYQQKTESI